MKITLAVAALLSIISKSDLVQAVNHRSSSVAGMTLEENSQSDAQAGAHSELGRFINSKGEAINLAQESGHARLVLEKVKKYTEPLDITNLGLGACDSKHTDKIALH